MKHTSKAAAAALLLGAVLLAGCNPAEGDIGSSSSPTTSASPVEAAPTETEEPAETGGGDENPATDDGVEALLHELRLNPEAALTHLNVMPIESGSMDGYDRDAQFPHWLDADAWGWEDELPYGNCDVRAAALFRDGKNVEVNENCTVIAGEWIDPYSGKVITDPASVQIDHLVPLANAYRSGASGWTVEQGRIFANAVDVVVISDSSLNQSKGDQGPESWRPPNEGAWCAYALHWVQIKSDYGLSLNSQEEHDALTEMIATCEEQPA